MFFKKTGGNNHYAAVRRDMSAELSQVLERTSCRVQRLGELSLLAKVNYDYLSVESMWCFSRIREAKLLAEASCSVASDADRYEMLYRLGMIDPYTEDEYVKFARSF
ncbi:unnamed protein product [Angiostrongylus costaricensis]|uniref:DUF4476 domain-containing protein n=1 Tax=Angiostrongylus costaricensis TaxID=334426 RepID=A0A0R3PDE5_ANGCS|nr:unnamed protein product [Angiostrongylus costaricensis]